MDDFKTICMKTGYYVIKKDGLFSTCYLHTDGRSYKWVEEAPLASHMPLNRAVFILAWAKKHFGGMFTTLSIVSC